MPSQTVILYFYPRDNTPGCTQQAKDFTATKQAFEQSNTVIIGVSRDSEKSHANFSEKYGINYDLIADTDETICNLYGVMKDKNMYGKMVRGIERSTFFIDANGIIQKIWRKVKVPGHVEKVLDIVKMSNNQAAA